MGQYHLTPEEKYLYSKGELHKSYHKFGAHKDTENQITGIRFNLWAPAAKNVMLMGNFNNWQGSQMEFQDGVWSIFIPQLEEGEIYKYQIEDQHGKKTLKADPYAFYSEIRPKTASVVYELKGYSWQDESWLKERKKRQKLNAPMNIYEVHLGSWKTNQDGSSYSYRQHAKELVKYVKEMGYTHLELMPVMEHPLDNSWGYQLTGYYAATSRYGTPKELMHLIDQAHQAGIGIILDWVPGHFCPDEQGLINFDGTPLYGWEKHKHWGTYKFDFNTRSNWSFLISNALFWYDHYHIDGIRVDAITSMLRLDYGNDKEFTPNFFGGYENLEAKDFIQELNKRVFKYYPDVLMIAEESSDWPLVTKPPHDGGLGFNYKWNMGWMNDTLEYIEEEFQHRKYHHNLLTFSLAYAYSENFILPLSHDEVVHGKKSLLDKQAGDYWQMFAGLRLLYLYQMTHPGKKLLFMGGEFGQFIEWREYEALDWLLLDYEKHRRVKEYCKHINHLYLQEKALYENDQNWDGFNWLEVNNTEQSILSYQRKAQDTKDYLLVILNFKPVAYEHYKIGVPEKIGYQEIFNSDALEYGGSGVVNKGEFKARKGHYHGQEYNIHLRIPPLGGIILKPVR